MRIGMFTYCVKAAPFVTMLSEETIILKDILFSKIPGSSKTKCVPYYVELTPTRLHIFQTVPRPAGEPSTSRQSPFVKEKQIRSLWRERDEDVKKIDRQGRRSHMYKFYIKRPDGLYKFKIADEKQRDKWVEELLASSGSRDVDTNTASAHVDLHPEISLPLQLVDVPSTSYASDHSKPPIPARSVVLRIQPWLEPVKTVDGSGHLPLQRIKSTDSDFPRSRSVSLHSISTSDVDYGVTSESGYSSGDVDTRSRSVSRENMSDSGHSQATSPDDSTKSFLFPPKGIRLPEEHAVKKDGNKLLLSELENITRNLDDLKSLSPVPEESELELSTKSDSSADLEVVYLKEDALEYKVGCEGKIISLIEDLGIVIDIPPGAISGSHSNEVIVRINACLRGPFELPEGYELASPIFYIEPGAKFAEKPIELSMVHYLNIRDEQGCRGLQFISAPVQTSSEKATIKFKQLGGGLFWPERRIGKISLQHFCLIGIAFRKSSPTNESEDGRGDLSPTSRPVLPSKSKGRYIALLYSPLSFPVQRPCAYHIIFSISMSHPVFIKNLDNQITDKFSAGSKLWRTSCEVEYAADVIELDIPHDTLKEIGYEVYTDLCCSIRKETVDNIRMSRLSRSDYANYIDYPPRILMRVQQTPLNQTPNRKSTMSYNLRPKLKLKGTLEEKSFNLPLPESTPADLVSLSSPSKDSQTLPSPLTTQAESQLLPSPVVSHPSRKDSGTLLSPHKHQSLYNIPDLQVLGERVTPHVHHKWHHIGIQMGLNSATLNAIELSHPTDIQRRLNEVFIEWISRSEQNPTWTKLIEILRSNSIGEQKLAHDLERLFD